MKPLEYQNYPLTDEHLTPQKSYRAYDIQKRFFDLIVVTFASVAALPIIGISALLIKIISPGSPFFPHERVGLHGKMIRVWKLRTMHCNSQELLAKHLAENPEAKVEWEQFFKLKNDPRIIQGIGNMLRKTSMDELPQLWNIFKGEMSVVGPRPVTLSELDFYGEAKRFYLAVLPGLTGLWQVSGRNNTTYEERVVLDTKYVYERSILFDLKIFFKTFYVVFVQDGAC